MSYERPDRARRVVETVEQRWDDAADRTVEVVLASRPMTAGEVAAADLARYKDEHERLADVADDRRREALEAMDALERTAQAGRTLILAARDGDTEPGTYTALARQIDRWQQDARTALLAAGQARGELLWTAHLRDRAKEAYDAAVAGGAEATP